MCKAVDACPLVIFKGMVGTLNEQHLRAQLFIRQPFPDRLILNFTLQPEPLGRLDLFDIRIQYKHPEVRKSKQIFEGSKP
jgi:hypothetical protein